MYKVSSRKLLKKLGYKYLGNNLYDLKDQIYIKLCQVGFCGLNLENSSIIIDFILINKNQPQEFWENNLNQNIYLFSTNEIITEKYYSSQYFLFLNELATIKKLNLSEDNLKNSILSLKEKYNQTGSILEITFKLVNWIKELENNIGVKKC